MLKILILYRYLKKLKNIYVVIEHFSERKTGCKFKSKALKITFLHPPPKKMSNEYTVFNIPKADCCKKSLILYLKQNYFKSQ